MKKTSNECRWIWKPFGKSYCVTLKGFYVHHHYLRSTWRTTVQLLPWVIRCGMRIRGSPYVIWRNKSITSYNAFTSTYLFCFHRFLTLLQSFWDVNISCFTLIPDKILRVLQTTYQDINATWLQHPNNILKESASLLLL